MLILLDLSQEISQYFKRISATFIYPSISIVLGIDDMSHRCWNEANPGWLISWNKKKMSISFGVPNSSAT